MLNGSSTSSDNFFSTAAGGGADGLWVVVVAAPGAWGLAGAGCAPVGAGGIPMFGDDGGRTGAPPGAPGVVGACAG